jgi:hypothetical protein
VLPANFPAPLPCISGFSLLWEGKTIRIRPGDTRWQPYVSGTTWIDNIFGVSTVSGTTAAVVVSDGGQLGTVASSERFKKDCGRAEGERTARIEQIRTTNGAERTVKPQAVKRSEIVADAHRDDRNRSVVRVDEKLSAFLELEAAIRGISQFHPHMHCKRHSAGTETYD